LGNFFARLRHGGDVKIVYFGGSITDQSGWRCQTLAHFQNAYPTATVTGVNAAIGGTGSDLGVFRIERDVLVHRPDLVFVEFAVNDAATEPAEIARAMEGIVRKTWRALPQCDICFVYTLTYEQLPDLREGRLFRSAATMEALADHYAIPSIFMGTQVVMLEKTGRMVMSESRLGADRVSGDELDRSAPMPVNAEGKIVFAPDGVHPYNDTGHRLYTEAVVRSLPTIDGAGVSSPHTLIAPMMADNLDDAVLLPIEQATMRGPWRTMSTTPLMGDVRAKALPNVCVGEVGAELTLRFRGGRIGFYDLVGPDGGRLEITVDGQTTHTLRFDPWCYYHRLAVLKAARDLDANAVHTVTIRVLSDAIDKGAILLPEGMEDFGRRPELYAENRWHVGAIFLCGQLA
jgi:lysophospholipase L1-like esterase